MTLDGLVLKPWKSVPSGAMSANQALAAAGKFSDPSLPAAPPLEAELIVPGNAAVDHLPVWVVTYTSSTPVDVGVGGGPGAVRTPVTHRSVAVNAVTGKFALGFFER